MAAATADVVIVGGGVMGTSIALQLARRRAGRVVLLEKRHVASGPTGRSSALLRRHYSIELYARMAARSFEAYRNFEELTGRPAEITRCGLVMALAPDDVPAMRDTIAMMQRLGVKVEELTPRDLARVVPGLSVDGLGGAAWETDTGYGDPAGVSQAYAARARELGVEIRQDCHVLGFTVTGGRISGVRTSAGPVETATVVNAAGPWGAALSRAVGVDLPIVASRQQLVILRPRADATAPRPVLVDMVDRAYYRPETGGLVLVGTRNRAGVSAPVDPDAFSERVDADRGGGGASLPRVRRRGGGGRLRLGLRSHPRPALRHRAQPDAPRARPRPGVQRARVQALAGHRRDGRGAGGRRPRVGGRRRAVLI